MVVQIVESIEKWRCAWEKAHIKDKSETKKQLKSNENADREAQKKDGIFRDWRKNQKGEASRP